MEIIKMEQIFEDDKRGLSGAKNLSKSDLIDFAFFLNEKYGCDAVDRLKIVIDE